ncbi:hypothetical protein HMJ29_16770 [Hymenobacter taeanensis]|uniref:Uncharacterized protein n=1 Tax=Hymenobacter taeanensis TaxID=2735321 RepID=A0A6M6BKU7_9BACT|nr:hypothetical protein [Hymenobacter taeanensis]QJX48478.1 hypothetical protein HMJ29_16770 [Hymenobacter taeanensis]
MKKLLLAVLALAAGTALALLLRQPPSPAHPPVAAVPIIRKPIHDVAPIKHVTTVPPALYAGHHHTATK